MCIIHRSRKRGIERGLILRDFLPCLFSTRLRLSNLPIALLTLLLPSPPLSCPVRADVGGDAFQAGAFCIEGDPLWSSLALDPEYCPHEYPTSLDTLCPWWVAFRHAYLGGGYLL